MLLILTCIALVISALPGLPAYSQTVDPSALQQIRELLQEKDARTPAQRKLDSQLVYSEKALFGERLTPSIDMLPNPFDAIDMDADGRVLVDIQGYPTDDVLANINMMGGEVYYSSARNRALRARIPLSGIEVIAGMPEIDFVKPGDLAKVNRMGLGAYSSARMMAAPLKMVRGLLVPSAVARLLEPLTMFAGSLMTQGDVSHQTNMARSRYGINGTGIRVGVLSDTAEEIPFLIGTGDLPADVVDVQDLTGGSSEGTAMMEIVYDMVPGAKLFFATAFNGQQSFADNIRTLRNVYHCDVIVDDVSYFAEPAFQDGVIARAVNDVTADGALYFSSAANSGNLTSGTSGTYEGDFANGGTNALLPGYTLHNFGGGQAFDRLTVNTSIVDLKWSDPLGASINDYDLFVLNSAGTAVLYSSVNIQNGTQDPYEQIFRSAGIGTNNRIVIAAKATASVRALHMDTWGGRLSIATSGSTHGHNGGPNTVSVAAVYWNSARTGTRAFVGGAANPTEIFSSDGPRRMFYNPDGTAITPGNFLFGTNGGALYAKPDIAAADGVATRTPGFFPFFGTSAAAPHAAGIAALIKSRNPSWTNAQIYQAMIQSALDIRAPGVDRDAGYGIVMATRALFNLLGF